MPKCKTCNGCLDTYGEGEVVLYHCFLCNKLFDLKTRKELNLFSSIYLVKFKGEQFAMSGRMFKHPKELEYHIRESLPDEDVEIVELPIFLSKNFLIKELEELL